MWFGSNGAEEQTTYCIKLLLNWSRAGFNPFPVLPSQELHYGCIFWVGGLGEREGAGYI